MIEFRVTFGVQYATEAHPASWPHPDGWLAVHADDEETAREVTSAILGNRWAFIYGPDGRYPTEDRYPRGQLHEIWCAPPPKNGDEHE